MNPKNDPDDTPTRFDGGKPADGNGGPADGEDGTVPSLKKGRSGPAETPPAAADEGRTVPSLKSGERPPKQTGKPAGAKPPAPGGDEDRTVPSMSQGGQPAPPPSPRQKGDDPLIGSDLGGCRIESLLGRGAMGAVYRARQLRLDRHVAVKIIRPEMMTDPRTLKRFEVEARTVGRFNSANVVMVHDVGFEKGVHYLVMEFVQGKNLRDHVKLLAGGRLPAAEAIPLMRQACKGLEEAQRLGVIHRDIKPDNLMLTDRGVLKIADFGIAKPAQDDFSLTMSSELIGTPLYMSPEQCQGIADLDFRSDMYSLGATFYYLLTGEPPVRASSVYELIQTKTKLENLCLWKALPELDENHPLSRVIERMTALERDDRYESYEALLNDIVLVEQGSTIDRIPKKPKAAMPRLVDRRAPRRSGRLVALVVGLLVVAGAGGAYWWQTHDIPGSPRPDPAHGGALEPAAAKARLLALRGRFAKDGPSAALEQELSALAVDAAAQAEREQLLADVRQGLTIKARLEQLPAPKALALPFTDLRAHFAAVDTALATSGVPGRELQEWLAKAAVAARDERTLGAEGKSRLMGAFTQWQTERGRTGDADKLLQLRERLGVIEAGRHELLALLPGLRTEVDALLPVATLDAARRGLDETSVPVEDIDASEALAGFAAELQRDGPKDSLRDAIQRLRTTRQDQRNEQIRLTNSFQLARDCKRDAESTRTTKYPAEPRLPFTDIADYFEQLDRALEPVRADGALPPWAESLRVSLRDETSLQGKVLAVCRGAFETWQRDSEAPTAAVAQLESSLATLTSGIQRAATLFPAAKDELEKVVPADALAKARSRLERAQQRNAALAAAPALLSALDRVRTIADWRSTRDAWLADFARLQQQAQPFADDADVSRELRNVEQLRDRWVQASERVDQFAARFAQGDLAGARSIADASVLGSEGRDELRALGAVVSKCTEAFRAFDEQLDVDRTVALLGDAAGLLRDQAGLAPPVVARITAWTDRLGDLRRAAAAMVPIPAGATKSGPVAAFFLGCTEVSQAEFLRFLDELDALVGSLSGDARQAKLATRLGDLVLPAYELDDMLARRRKLPDPDLPVDRTTWWQAAAYARWYGLSLPTRAEWALAAFGDNHRYEFPWGGDWKMDDACRNIGNRLVPVTAGGRSWRSGNGREVHHLAGNVAEWLQAEPGASTGWLAGGRCQDSLSDARRRAAGEDFHEASLGKALDGFGFRVILRPREFLGSDFPSGRPAGGR